MSEFKKEQRANFLKSNLVIKKIAYDLYQVGPYTRTWGELTPQEKEEFFRQEETRKENAKQNVTTDITQESIDR